MKAEAGIAEAEFDVVVDDQRGGTPREQREDFLQKSGSLGGRCFFGPKLDEIGAPGEELAAFLLPLIARDPAGVEDGVESGI